MKTNPFYNIISRLKLKQAKIPNNLQEVMRLDVTIANLTIAGMEIERIRKEKSTKVQSESKKDN